MPLNKGNLHNQGKESDRFYFNKDQNLYMYPCQKYIVEIFSFGSYNDNLEVGDVISTATGKVPYDMGSNLFSAHTVGEEVDYPCNYTVRCHPIGYNYDTYLEDADEGFHGYDYYVVDEILESSK